MVFTKEELKHRIKNKTKPEGSLGMLEDLAYQIGCIQKSVTPKLEKPTILVFAADHGISDEGVSPYPKEVTAQMVLNFLSGGAAINVFCKQNGIALRIIDAGVNFDFAGYENLMHAKIRKGTRNMLKEPAMNQRELQPALKIGGDLVEKEFKMGCNVIGFGEMGIGNTSSAALLMHKFCRLPIEDCVGNGTGHTELGLKRKLEILKRISRKYSKITKPEEILATLGGLEIAMITGAMLKARELNMVMLVDGFPATSALLVANAINNLVAENCIFCHRSDEKGHKLMLDFLNAKPVLDLGLRLGEGTGAAIAYPVIQAAVSFLNEMASFDEAGVSTRR
jgi:nicotinate-nucleotide--dimethylbenzimidazole phosphoribosyltransferase